MYKRTVEGILCLGDQRKVLFVPKICGSYYVCRKPVKGTLCVEGLCKVFFVRNSVCMEDLCKVFCVLNICGRYYECRRPLNDILGIADL